MKKAVQKKSAADEIYTGIQLLTDNAEFRKLLFADDRKAAPVVMISRVITPYSVICTVYQEKFTCMVVDNSMIAVYGGKTIEFRLDNSDAEEEFIGDMLEYARRHHSEAREFAISRGKDLHDTLVEAMEQKHHIDVERLVDALGLNLHEIISEHVRSIGMSIDKDDLYDGIKFLHDNLDVHAFGTIFGTDGQREQEDVVNDFIVFARKNDIELPEDIMKYVDADGEYSYGD